MRGFISKNIKDETAIKERVALQSIIEKMEFSQPDQKLILESLGLKKEEINYKEIKSYLTYVLTLSQKDQRAAILDIAQLGEREEYSNFLKKFRDYESRINRKIISKELTNPKDQDRYRELFYGCRALRPNEVNKNAGRDFKRFALSLSLGTIGASYVYYNMDKEIDGEWFAKLGFELSMSLLYTYMSSMIQTNPMDSQLSKSLKSYLLGRASGLTDIAIYDPLFNKERENAERKIAELKNNPKMKEEINELLMYYQERGLYRKYKDEIINSLKKLPSGISLGLKGNSKDKDNIDWNNLTHEDLDKPIVQEVLVAAAMAQAYQMNKGEWIETSDAGIDRYAFNTLFYAAQIPRSMAQSYLTYQILCMGQDTPKLAFTKAVLFNVTSNFFVNQLLYEYRPIAVGANN